MKYGMGILAIGLWCGVLAAATFNVRDFGATGDGRTDDRAALQRAVAELRTQQGGELWFPAGEYRVAGEGYAALELRELNDVVIRFEEGAVLLVDNLRADGLGNGHGVAVVGPARNITLENVEVTWKTRPAGRSFGDAFRFDGYPTEEGAIHQVKMLRCHARRSPQAGAIFMGVSDIEVVDFAITDNLADGLHFNACRNIRVDGVTGDRTGDDTLAFVTYWAEKPEWVRGLPFSFSELNEWSNSNARAQRVRAYDGFANGVRISGANDVQVRDIQVERKSCGVIVDSGMADDVRFMWSYQPSRGVVIEDLTATACNSGFFVWCFSPQVPGFTEFEVTAGDLKLSRNENDNLHIWDANQVTLQRVSSEDGRVRLRGFRRLHASELQLERGYLEVDGQYDAGPSPELLEPLASSLTKIQLRDAFLNVTHCRDLELREIAVEDAPATAVQLVQCRQVTVDGLQIVQPNQSATPGARGLMLAGCGDIRIAGLDLRLTRLPLIPIEIGGGSAAYIPENIRIAGRVEALDAAAQLPEVVLQQTGAYAPRQVELDVTTERTAVTP